MIIIHLENGTAAELKKTLEAMKRRPRWATLLMVQIEQKLTPPDLGVSVAENFDAEDRMG